MEVAYRRQGETEWSPALPLLRLQGERIFVGNQFDVVVPNLFAGSILDLDPDTAYEAQFVMTDPDGGIGEAGRSVTVRTRAEPVPYAEGRVFHVYPHGFEGEKIESIAGAKGLTVKHSRFEDVGVGVFTNYSGSSNFYVADNRFHGRNDPERLIGWSDAPLWGRFDGVDGQVHPPVMASYVAVKLYGPGHVVAHNYIADFHDGINVETYGNPDGSVASGPGMPDGPRYPPREYRDRRPVAIDFYNNIITNSHDNPIETDGSLHNVRVLRNLFINHPSHAFCSQPVLGGPVYWIRNIGYNLPGGSTRFFGAAGVVFYNNTILSETTGTTSNRHWRNNLILGQNAAPDFRRLHPNLFGITTFTNYTSSDYNGFGPAPDTAMPFRWESPPFDAAADFRAPDHAPALELREFATLEEYSAATGQDRNSVEVGYDVFVNVPALDARDVSTLQAVYDADDLDFRLRPGSAAVDRGMVLPTVTDGFTGSAPDLGALEVGVAAPHYGPRD